MRPKTIAEEIFEDGVAQGLAMSGDINQGIANAMARSVTQCLALKRDEYTRNLIRLGLLTDEQIAVAMKQPPEYIATLRNEIEATKN